ncbi:MAG: hypothetical protein ABSC15_19750 [Terriglobales bacterium]|jgi:hypothetical protein
MTATDELGVLASLLTLLGALALSVEALFVRRKIRTEAGGQRLLAIMKAHGDDDVLTDPKSGKPLNKEKALRLWFAERSLGWSWLGFALMMVGFLLDLIAKWKSAH